MSEHEPGRKLSGTGDPVKHHWGPAGVDPRRIEFSVVPQVDSMLLCPTGGLLRIHFPDSSRCLQCGLGWQ